MAATSSSGRLGSELRMLRGFIAVGVFVAATNLAIYAGLLHLGVPYLAAAVVGFLVSTVVSFLGNRRFTFVDAPAMSAAQATRFLLVQLTGLGVNLGVLTLGVQVLSIHEFPAEIIASGAQSTFTFLANRLWTFRAPAAPAAVGPWPVAPAPARAPVPPPVRAARTPMAAHWRPRD